MKKQPVVSVGIMAESLIRFKLETGYHQGRTQLKAGEYSIEIREQKMILQGNDILVISEDQIILLPLFRTNAFLLYDVTIGIQFHWEKKENQRFTGGLRFVPENGKIRVINTVYLEDYLKSVISSEMSATCPAELLKAHAVISRSWLLAQIEKNNELTAGQEKYETTHTTPGELVKWYDREDHTGFDVCADDHCQRYQGITRIISSEAVEAVEATTGEVLMSDGKICDARFSKCCGGITESFENVWEPEPKSYLVAITDSEHAGNKLSANLREEEQARKWIRGAPDAFCNTADKKLLSRILPDYDRETKDFFRWRVTYTRQELSALVRKRSGIDFGEITALEPLERGFSGRIIRLKISGTRQSYVVGKELEIRKWLSASHLYSAAFVVETEKEENGLPGKFILQGAGWGHGVGLCQIGAAVMGEKGYLYSQILGHYFRKATISKLYKS